MPANKVKLTVCGSNYVISTTDSEEYVQSLAERLDRDMNDLMNQSPSASVAASAVVVALGYLDELQKNASSADNMRSQIKDYLEDAAKAKLAAEQARREEESAALRWELRRPAADASVPENAERPVLSRSQLQAELSSHTVQLEELRRRQSMISDALLDAHGELRIKDHLRMQEPLSLRGAAEQARQASEQLTQDTPGISPAKENNR